MRKPEYSSHEHSRQTLTQTAAFNNTVIYKNVWSITTPHRHDKNSVIITMGKCQKENNNDDDTSINIQKTINKNVNFQAAK